MAKKRATKRATKKKAATKKQTRPGRPPGGPATGSGTASVSKCPKCESTRRTPYNNTKAIPSAGNHPDFGRYTHIVIRHTKCLKCGQSRVDRSYENRR